MQDIVTYLINAAGNLPGIQSAIFLIAGVVGLFSIVFSLIHQVSAGRRGEGPLPATIAGICFGSLLLSLPTVVDIVSVSFFGSASDPQIIGDSIYLTGQNPVYTGDATRISIQVLVAFINVFGWFAVARGLWRWRIGPKYDQPGWFGSGAAFIVAGAIATNLYVFADILAVSVGAMPIGTNYFKF